MVFGFLFVTAVLDVPSFEFRMQQLAILIHKHQSSKHQKRVLNVKKIFLSLNSLC